REAARTSPSTSVRLRGLTRLASVIGCAEPVGAGGGGPVTTQAIESEEHGWGLESPALTMFDFDYQDGRDQLLRLYDKGTRRQWIGSDRIDWSGDVDPENPLGVPDDVVPIVGTEWWNKMGAKDRGEVRRHLAAWQFSQFMHGE